MAHSTPLLRCQLEPPKPALIQLVDDSPHGTNPRTTQSLIKGPQFVFDIASANHHEPLELQTKTSRRRRIKTAPPIEDHQDTSLGRYAMCSHQSQSPRST